MMPYEWRIGLRYLKAKRSQNFISVITFFSAGGIALGVAALIVVLAVMTGFKEELQRQILGVTNHVVIRAYGGIMDQNPSLEDRIRTMTNVQAVSPFILKHVMLTRRGTAQGAVIRGIHPELEKNVSDLHKNIAHGNLADLSGFGIALGKQLAANLGVGIGDAVTVVAASAPVTVAGTMPRLKRFRVTALSDSGMHEYDSTLAYIDLNDAQTFFRMKNRVTGIGIRTDHPENAFAVRRQLNNELHGKLLAQDWMQMNRNFFRALKLEKATMFVILSLIVLVAAFNIVSSLIMVVMEKGRDIAILKTMGATAGSILAVFVINGSVIGISGTVTGLLLGLTLAFNLEPVLTFIEKIFEIQILSGEIYYIDHLPSVVAWTDVIWIMAISLLISLFATLYPAWRATRVDPVEILRYV